LKILYCEMFLHAVMSVGLCIEFCHVKVESVHRRIDNTVLYYCYNSISFASSLLGFRRRSFTNLSLNSMIKTKKINGLNIKLLYPNQVTAIIAVACIEYFET